MLIDIISATVFVDGNGPDKVVLTTNLKDAGWPYTGPLCLSFRAATNSGKQYCAKNFTGVPVSVIDPRKRK